jgi:hypothetical protein
MRVFSTILLLFCGLIFHGCFLRAHDIREITLSGGGISYNGKGSFSSITFRKDGSAEKTAYTFEHDVPKVGEVFVHQRARVSTEQFDGLVRAINDNGFFSKKEREGIVYDAHQAIKVMYSGGEKEIETLARDDAGIDAMVKAITDLNQQMHWETVPPAL